MEYNSPFIFWQSDLQVIKAKDTQACEAFVDVADLQTGTQVLDLGWEGDCLECLQKTGAQVAFVGEDIRAVQKAEALRINGVLSAMPGTGDFRRACRILQTRTKICQGSGI